MNDVKQQLIDLINSLNDEHLLYVFTLLKKLFGSS